ncbi:MAG: VCBS repeat-containing protein [Acidobacteria bacterium]|uniref:VCBS repeat-containing protein n=1 Tax=Candidatus Polarisedimenticola svalbardensis TaxID=2886004 RepID=A0A8J6Y5W9_9BACT|nr:VCBS repeat-containing protein [Candidatus Polarisedimenticola svalbardensis]
MKFFGDRPVPATLILIILLGSVSATAARKESLALKRQTLDLPGPPSKVLSTDVNQDGLQDLVVVVAYTERHQIGIDRVEGMVQFTEVIPAIFDRREVRVFLGSAAGGYQPEGHALELPFTVLSMEPGPPGSPIVAVTDDGLSEVVLDLTGADPTLELKEIFRDRPVLAGSGAFQPHLTVVHDLDGDGEGDILFPSKSGPAVYRARGGVIESEPVQRLDLYGHRRSRSRTISQHYPFPKVRHLNGDDLPDLIYAYRTGPQNGFHVLLGTGGGRFEPLRTGDSDCWDRATDVRIAVSPRPDGAPPYPWLHGIESLRDLDGDGLAEAIVVDEQSRDGGMRAELKDAKRPVQNFRFHRLGRDLRIDPEPYHETEAMGHLMEGEGEDVPFSVEVFQDLDNDGREDLILVTLDFSVFQAVKIMVTKKISIGLDFHVWHQRPDGSFKEVNDLDLSEKLKLDLNDLKFGRFAQFGGDFDGDGIQDFVHLGRGKKVTIHRGRTGCVYPKNPDLVVELEEEPPHLGLVTIEDLDGDGLSDIRIARPAPARDQETTTPVTLELYLSGGGS